jgi:hypothetical protein
MLIGNSALFASECLMPASSRKLILFSIELFARAWAPDMRAGPDLNDFDEATFGPSKWGLKRLVAM